MYASVTFMVTYRIKGMIKLMAVLEVTVIPPPAIKLNGSCGRGYVLTYAA